MSCQGFVARCSFIFFTDSKKNIYHKREFWGLGLGSLLKYHIKNKYLRPSIPTSIPQNSSSRSIQVPLVESSQVKYFGSMFQPAMFLYLSGKDGLKKKNFRLKKYREVHLLWPKNKKLYIFTFKGPTEKMRPLTLNPHHQPLNPETSMS